MDANRLGRFLVSQSILSRSQLDQIIHQQHLDRRPLWEHAAELTNLAEADIWEHCARALMRECPRTNLFRERFDPSCLSILSPRESWQNLVLPLRVEDGVLVCATTEETLAGALPLMLRLSSLPFRFVIASVLPLEQFIAERYHYEGVEVED